MTPTSSSLKQQLDYTDLLDHMKQHPQKFVVHLFKHPCACAAIFGELPELAKHFILRALFIDQSVPLSWALGWIKEENSKEKDIIMRALKEIHIVVDESMNGTPMFKLQDDFKKNMRITLAGRKEEWLDMKSLERDKYTKDVEFLDQYARKRWECILNFILKSDQGQQTLSDVVVDILVHARLIEMEGKTHKVTPQGFRFLLLDVTKQVWILTLKMLEMLHKQGINYQGCLIFLFKLNFLPSGKDYSTANLSGEISTILQYLREFGLVYQRTRKSQRFSVTRLASNLTTSTCQELKLEINEDAGLIIDNDYTINASDPSGNLNTLLDIFTTELFRSEGRKICQMDRSSCLRALEFGITATQLVQFLRSHASKVTMNTDHGVPPTVVDQIYLWEAELNKVKSTDGVIYKDFKLPGEFENFRDYALEMNALIWENQMRRVIVITKKGHLTWQEKFIRERGIREKTSYS